MKKFILIIGITITIIILSSLRYCSNKSSITTTDSTTYWKDKYGTEHISRLTAETNTAASRQLYDSVKNRIKNNPQTITAVGTTTTGTITPQIDTIYLNDSTTEYNFKYNDHWLSLDGTIGKQPIINYRVTDSIIITTCKKNKATYIDGYSLNPNVHLTGITNLKLSTGKQTHFSIGPYIGYSWNGKIWSTTIGISLQYSLVKF